MNYNIIKLYGKTLRLRRGISLSIFLTFRCNQTCDYCAMKLATGKMPRSEESMVYEWLDIIDRFPVKIKEIIISGGEPTLYSDLEYLINVLLDKGYHVKVYSNLYNVSALIAINKSYRFIVHSTFHKSDNKDAFLWRYNKVKAKHRIEIFEILNRTIPGSILLPKFDQANQLPRFGFRMAPDRQLYIGCYDIYYQKSK